MYIFLSKKIAIPNNVKLKSLSWNGPQGWIACGGATGLLKVLHLEPAKGQGRGLAAPSNLSMNQTLEGHEGAVLCTVWNENYRKLTTSDEHGLIIVWMLYKGLWYEEMINNRNKSVVTDMCWTGDGQKICIVYADGMVIVGAVGGNRLWGSNMEKKLTTIAWSPDSRLILFGVLNGEVHMHDSDGGYMTKFQVYCLDDVKGPVKIVGIKWYNGSEGYIDGNAPCLAVAYENGRVQISRHETDDKPVLIDTEMRAVAITWNRHGSVLAVAGKVTQDEKEVCVVQFFSPFGQNLCVLKVPGPNITTITWAYSGLRVALAVDSHIYFANIRPDYKWGFFSNTVVYAYTKPDRNDTCVVFWNCNTKDKWVKYVKKIISIHAAGDNCVLITKTEEEASQYIVILFDAIGTPLDSRYIEVEPLFVSMTGSHVAVASENAVYVWHYSQNRSTAYGRDKKRKESKEKMFHIDQAAMPSEGGSTKFAPTRDGICCICACDTMLLVGRESGTVHRYTLPHIALEQKYTLFCRPQMIAVNCDKTVLSIIDIGGILTFFELEKRGENGRMGVHLNQKTRSNVWDMKWSTDNPDLFCMMEKTKMYILRALEPEEPIESSAYICEFSDLVVKGVLLDEIMENPDSPSPDMIIELETRSLRDTRDILNTVGIRDALLFVDDNPHPRLYRILGEAGLEAQDLVVANNAFMKCLDYQGIRFVNRLNKLDDKLKQKAEVAAYFGRFDEAERRYQDIDRDDLAIDLRVRLGDWFRVKKLLQKTQAGDDKLMNRAHNELGDYYAERQKWDKALPHYFNARNMAQLAEGYYSTERYDSLEQLAESLTDADPLLKSIGDKFVTIGLSEAAVAAYLKFGDVQAAVDCCVLLNKWDEAVRLAEKNKTFGNSNISSLLGKYATHLLEGGKTLEAIELYQRSNHFKDAAKLLFDLAVEAGKSKVPVRAKKLYVLAAMSADQHLAQKGGDTAKSTLEGLLLDDDTGGAADHALDGAWRGAEGYHLYLLAQRQLYDGKADVAMTTALRLRDYDDIVDPLSVHSVVALASFQNKFFAQCSKAFIKLEAREAEEGDTTAFEDVAVSIFTKYPPKDPDVRTLRCPSCAYSPLYDWSSSCDQCETHFPACMATGRTIFNTGSAVFTCKNCKHKSFERDVQAYCPLCHAAA